jgi:hypothetical protein
MGVKFMPIRDVLSILEIPACAGAEIAPRVRKEMECLFGQSFAGVRIYRKAVHPVASAFSSSECIVIDHDTELDRRLLAHELAHVVQQRRAAALRDGIGREGDELELEAEAAAAAVTVGRSVRIGYARTVQRIQCNPPRHGSAHRLHAHRPRPGYLTVFQRQIPIFYQIPLPEILWHARNIPAINRVPIRTPLQQAAPSPQTTPSQPRTAPSPQPAQAQTCRDDPPFGPSGVHVDGQIDLAGGVGASLTPGSQWHWLSGANLNIGVHVPANLVHVCGSDHFDAVTFLHDVSVMFTGSMSVDDTGASARQLSLGVSTTLFNVILRDPRHRPLLEIGLATLGLSASFGDSGWGLAGALGVNAEYHLDGYVSLLASVSASLGGPVPGDPSAVFNGLLSILIHDPLHPSQGRNREHQPRGASGIEIGSF